MESIIILFGINLAAVAAMMVIGWLISLIYRNVTVVDSLWGLGFVLVAWISFGLTEGYLVRKLLLCALTTAWGLRLSVYLTLRNIGKGEDPRYGSWRKEYGERFWIVSLFNVFLIQALVLWVIAVTVQFGQTAQQPAHLTLFDVAGIVVWLTGFVFETTADWQMARFKSNPSNRGKVLDSGLWAYSRHPNYFGEMLIWWGLFLITLSVPGGIWTIVSPVLITLVLLKVTGVALTEKTILEKRPEYREYIRKTSAFVPWFPRENH
ncbi:MAG TPA: DUF1295 domain-containing protein [Desulfobacterales bacterium]